MRKINVEKYVGTDKLILLELKNGLSIKGQIISYCEEDNTIEFETLKKTSYINLEFVLLIEIIANNFVPRKRGN